MITGNRVMNGTHGQAWVDGELWLELSAAQAKVTNNKEAVNICGSMAEDTKVTGTKGTGSLSVLKVYTRNADRSKSVMSGIEQRATVVLKLADPDAYGAERVALYNVSFDEQTLMDFAANSVSKANYPFTFTNFEYLDRVNP